MPTGPCYCHCHCHCRCCCRHLLPGSLQKTSSAMSRVRRLQHPLDLAALRSDRGPRHRFHLFLLSSEAALLVLLCSPWGRRASSCYGPWPSGAVAAALGLSLCGSSPHPRWRPALARTLGVLIQSRLASRNRGAGACCCARSCALPHRSPPTSPDGRCLGTVVCKGRRQNIVPALRIFATTAECAKYIPRTTCGELKQRKRM